MTAMTMTTLILAGSRGGSADPVAAAAGVSHKAVVPVAGQAMLSRVVLALAGCPSVGQILVAIERPELLDGLPELAALRDQGRVRCIEAAGSPARSVLCALMTQGTPLLVTTADHPLLTTAMIDHFLAQIPAEIDVVAALARQETIQAAYPHTTRTYLRFADVAISGCNLFLFATPLARAVVEFWRMVEQNRKKPIKMIRLLGVWSTLRFVLGRLPFTAVLERLHELTEARVGWVDMPMAEAAIDVDKPADLELAQAILHSRQGR